VLQVQSGSVDGTDSISFGQLDQLTNDPVADLNIWGSTQSYFIQINHRFPPFDDVKVRQALNYALDKQAMVDTVLYGKGQVATTYMPKGTMCWDPNNPGYPYDLEKAKQLMAESKYSDGADLVLQVPSGRVIGRDNATMAQAAWKEIGINVTINEMEGGLLSAENRENRFTAISGYQWTNDVLDPDPQTQWTIVDPAMHSGWVNERAIELVKAAAVELDQTKRCEMYAEIQKIFNDDAVNILLYHTPFNSFVSKEVKDFNIISLGWLRWHHVWLDR
jgi:peptide/nickel transport system substrate-binding protein